MLEPVYQTERLISLEHLLVASHKSVESLHVTLLHEVHDLVVRVEVLGEVFLIEDLSVRNLTHEQLDDDEELLAMDAEADGADLGRLAQAVDQAGLRLGVLELHGLDATLVVKVARVLVVRAALRELRLNHKVARLLVKVLLQVHSNDDVHRRGLPNLVLVQATVLVGLEDERTDLRQ